MNDHRSTETFQLIDTSSLNRDAENYEFLQGGRGREIFFRQERYRVAELLKEVGHLNPRVVSESFEGDLVDFAITGASCSCPGVADCSPGQAIPRVWIMIGDDTYYSGRARVVHATGVGGNNGTPAHTMVGLHLTDDVIDVDRVFQLRSAARAKNHMKETQVTLHRQDVVPEYKRGVADLVFLLVRYRSLLSQQEQQIRAAATGATEALESDLLETVWNSFRPRAFEIQEKLEDLTNPHYGDTDFRRLHRAFTLPILTPHMAAGPNWWRAWAKPLGYPGDYVLMTQFYEQGWKGDSLFAKLMHKYGDQQPMVCAVRSRMEFLRETIQGLVEARADSDSPTSLLCLGAGPARELGQIGEAYKGRAALEYTLIDQDNTALAFANRALSPMLVRGPKNLSVRYLYLAFKQLLGDERIFESIPDSHVVYSAGLFDYLPTGKAKLLLSKLFDKVQPGGTLIVGNFGGPPTAAWAPSYVLDWDLRYRTRKEMEELGSELGPRAVNVRVETEKLGMQFFVMVDKKV